MKSSKPKKQRKAFYMMPLHQRQKTMAAHLSPELRKKYKKRSAVVKKGDEVKVMRGGSRGKRGKVAGVDYKKRLLTIEGMTRKKSDGTERLIPFQASNVMIVTLDTTGKKRIERKGE